MEIGPAVWNGELDHGCHDQQTKRRIAGEKAKYQQDRQDKFGNSGGGRHGQRHWVGKLAAKNVQLEFLFE